MFLLHNRKHYFHSLFVYKLYVLLLVFQLFKYHFFYNNIPFTFSYDNKCKSMNNNKKNTHNGCLLTIDRLFY